MAALDDDREEKLAQELAKGASQALAWTNAGYPAKNSNVASVQCNKLLKRKPEINERADELRAIARDTTLTDGFRLDVENVQRLLLNAYSRSEAWRNAGAMVSAAGALAKLGKLGGDNPPGSPDNPFSSVTTIEIVAGEKPANG